MFQKVAGISNKLIIFQAMAKLGVMSDEDVYYDEGDITTAPHVKGEKIYKLKFNVLNKNKKQKK